MTDVGVKSDTVKQSFNIRYINCSNSVALFSKSRIGKIIMITEVILMLVPLGIGIILVLD